MRSMYDYKHGVSVVTCILKSEAVVLCSDDARLRADFYILGPDSAPLAWHADGL